MQHFINVAPCFITIAGKNSTQGRGISRDNKNTVNLQVLPALVGLEQADVIVQTSNGHNDTDRSHNILYSNERRKLVYDSIKKVKKKDQCERRVYLETDVNPPIHNTETVYETIMIPETCSRETRIADDNIGFL
jgi:hypothetical protein